MTHQTRKNMLKHTLVALLAVFTLALGACGQRMSGTDEDAQGQPQFNGNGEPVDGTPNLGSANPNALSLRLVSDINSIKTGGTDIANITALVTDANNNSVEDQEITFSSSGGVLQNITPRTNENGEASATLKLPHDFQNRDIVVSVSSGTFRASVMITALGSTLDISGPENLVFGDKAELSVSLSAGNGEPISNQVVSVESAVGNTIEPAQAVTDADGRVTILIGSENYSDTVRLTALNGTVSATHAFTVAEDVLRFVTGAALREIPVATESYLSVDWISQGAPVAGRELRFSTTAGEIIGTGLSTTNSQGRATIGIRSNSAGPAQVSVEAGSGGDPSTSVEVEFVATTPAFIEIDSSSTRVATLDTSTISALITDINGNPVKNKVVDFTSTDLKGGQLNPAYAKSNSSGVASITFTAGANATEINDVQITARVKDSSLSNPPQDSLQLTVVKRVLNVTLGTSNDIIVKPLGTQYALPFIVQVSDGSGNPLEGAAVKLSVLPLRYWKGYMALADKEGRFPSQVSEGWTAAFWRTVETAECKSEDDNRNRILDLGEDTNGNGSLDPQDPASLAAVEEGEYATIEGGSLQTDNNGSGFFELLYPASNSIWAEVQITARAQALGAEAVDTFHTRLRLPADEANETEAAPANYYSPYGLSADCTENKDNESLSN